MTVRSAAASNKYASATLSRGSWWRTGYRSDARGEFGIVQIGCGESVDLQRETVVLVGLADQLHSDAPCGRHTAGIAQAHNGEHLRYSVGESLMGLRVAGLSAVTVPPGRGGDLPADFEVGATGWNGNRETASMTRPLSRISIASGPSDCPASSCSVIQRVSSRRI
jgi:hypothetical protein